MLCYDTMNGMDEEEGREGRGWGMLRDGGGGELLI